MASGDVNGDGRGDVVYGWYDFDDPEVGHRRGFTLFTGTAGGRFAKGPTVYTTVHALAVGDFNGDRRADVAVGDSYDRPSTGGRVTVYPGSFLGLGRPSTIDRSTAGVPGQGVNEDDFGAALAVGDANRDGRADLAVGVPKADVGRAPDAGRAYVLFGSPAGLTGRGAQAISQSSPGIPGGAEPYDLFGAQVALLDHNGDGYADLAVGAPGENRDAGSVTVVRGGRGGLSTRGATGLSPRTFGVQSANPRLGTRLPH
ncbi:FG-GAP and VCBS repeat-containing protein [Actinomadura yumaensis]|uniref:FG-GAP and VCBS repeat-containing protein n=1 Tax=Actinomadura yumaensis TaxID=111807 RepID=UPI00361DA05C